MRNLASKIETSSIIAYKNLDVLNATAVGTGNTNASPSSSNSTLNHNNSNHNNNTNGSTQSVNSNFSNGPGKDQAVYGSGCQRSVWKFRRRFVR